MKPKWQKLASRPRKYAHSSFSSLVQSLLPKDTLLRTNYTTMVRPVLDYASAVWDPHQQGDIKILGQVQRRAARYVYNDFTTRHSDGERHRLGMSSRSSFHSQTEPPIQDASWFSGCGHFILLTTRRQANAR